VWFDGDAGRLVYNIEDPARRLLTANADVDVDRKTAIDPRQKAANVDGRSPGAILSLTFSDELAVHCGGKVEDLRSAGRGSGCGLARRTRGKGLLVVEDDGELVISSY
jgi:hypothetical protein